MSVLLPFRFKYFRKKFKNTPFRILDVGAGSHSASITKQWFPRCEYHGIDRVRDYENNEFDLILMDRFYQMDVTFCVFDEIPNAHFDVLMFSHIIEHLSNGDEVIQGLLPKLCRKGVVYIEFPSRRSVRFPSIRDSLNFYDDPTHCRLYSIEEIASLLEGNSIRVLKAGVRRDWLRLFLTPAAIIHSKVKRGYVSGGVFWDLFGFAEYIVGEKIEQSEND